MINVRGKEVVKIEESILNCKNILNSLEEYKRDNKRVDASIIKDWESSLIELKNSVKEVDRIVSRLILKK